MASVRKRGNKWQVQVRTNGHTATKTFVNKADALRWSRETERKADQDELAQDRTVLRSTTLADVLVRYRDEVVSRKKAGKNEACMLSGIMRHDAKSVSTTLDKLNAYQFSDWRDKRLQTMKPSSVCRYLGLIQHALDTAIRDWRMPLRVNPVRDVRRPTIRNKRERRLRDNERAALMDAARAYSNPLMAPLIVVALETGMRRGEMLSARWCDLDVRLSVLHLPTTKNGHARTVPLSVAALDRFATLPRGDERMFPMTPNAVLLAWNRICERSGVTDLHFHDLRHEAVSSFFERGLSMPEVAMISGHRDARMLMRYTHLHAVNIVKKLHSVL